MARACSLAGCVQTGPSAWGTARPAALAGTRVSPHRHASLSARAAVDGSSRPVRPVAPASPVAPLAPPPADVGLAPSPSPATTTADASTAKAAVSLEYQRQMAKELVAYFQEKKAEEASREGQVFGWTRKNEIGNGRWVMFGLAVGLITELATGVNFPTQIAILFENFGILD